jgi:hypothetical protein
MAAIIRQFHPPVPAIGILDTENQLNTVAETEKVSSPHDDSRSESVASSSPSSARSLGRENDNEKSRISSLEQLNPDACIRLGSGLKIDLVELFAENVAAKIWKVAVRELEREVSPSISFPFPPPYLLFRN